MKKTVLRKIKKYGFLAEPYIVMTNEEAERLVKSEGEPSFERIYASARGKHALPDEAWAPAERIIGKKKKRLGGVRMRIGGWSAAAALLIAALVFFTATKTGRALAGEAVKKIEEAYESIIPVITGYTPEPTLAPPTEAPAVITAEPTEAPTPEPLKTPVPTLTPAQTPVPTPKPTPVPTPEPTEIPPEIAAACCGEAGCYGGLSNGLPCCLKNGNVHICAKNFPDGSIRSQIEFKYSSKYDNTVLDENDPNSGLYFGIVYLTGSPENINGLELIPKMTSLIFEGFTISELNVTKIRGLKQLHIKSSHIGVIDFSGMSALFDASISETEIGELRCTGCNALTGLYFSHNNLTELDISVFPRIEGLTCSDSPIEKLIVGNCPYLKKLDAKGCRLTKIDITGAPNLHELYLQNNQLSEIKGLTDVPFYINISNNRLAAPVIERVINRDKPGYWNTTRQHIGPVKMNRTGNGFTIDFSPYLYGYYDRVRSLMGTDLYGEDVEGYLDMNTGIAYFDEPLLEVSYQFFDNYADNALIEAKVELEEAGNEKETFFPALCLIPDRKRFFVSLI